MRRSLLGPLRSLRGRWLIIQTVGLAVILTLASWLVYNYSRDVVLNEVTKGGIATGNIVRDILSTGSSLTPQQVQDLLLRLRAEVTGVVEIFVVDTNGIIIAHNDPERVGADSKEPEIRQALLTGFRSVVVQPAGFDPSQPGVRQGEHVQIVLPVHGKYDSERHSAITGAVVLDVDIAAAGSRIRHGFELLLVTLGALLTLFVVIQYFAFAGGYRRLAALGEATSQFGRGNYNIRLKPGGPTEVRQLDDAFNAMASRVQEKTAELQEAKQAAEAATRAKSQFLANVSHEIRTPLTGVVGYATLVSDDPDLGEQSRRYVERIVKATNALRALIEDMLDVSRIEAGRIVIRPRPFEIADLLDTCLSVFHGAALAKGVPLTVSYDPRLPKWLVGDGDRIRQVLLNFLSNAVKFTQAGKIEVGAALDKRDGGNATVRFFVKDTGIGIDESHKSKVFERFVQADESIAHRFGGTGLGLAISKDLVSLMGGEIGLDSEPGKGSTFWFTLTLKVGEKPAAERVVAGPDGPSRRLRILVADDNEMNRDVVNSMLITAGQTVDLAVDGEDAVNKFCAGRYDLILMDIRMPGLDGLEATRQIRTMTGNAGVPIVAMTANVMPDQIALYRAAGMNDFLGKPIDAQELIRILGRWCNRSAARATAEAAPQPPGPPVHDPAALKTVKDLLGEEKTRVFLGNLGNTLARLNEAPDGSDREGTAKYAHSFVSLSGQLGFAKLSASARALETACLSGEGIDRAMAEFKAAGAEARGVLAGLMAERAPAEASAEPPRRAASAS